ncbi:MAG: 1-acyl-sn-glycerol-3-phosphate acyltransferase, partial [Paludibacteraceae bacterium]|nr:1-acyl-sn-glycerol-3-phosphate acyltransferase [Paludibacteraceae bacterium]
MDTTFDDIRAYRDEELMSTLARLTQSDRFWQAVLSVYPNENRDSLTSRLNGLNGIEDFQVRMVFPIMHMIEQRLTSGIRAIGLDRIDEGPHVFISNHRDIILDSALLDKCLVENGRHTVEIAIGNNLLIEPWIEDLVRLNRSFIVRRGGGMREVLTNSLHLSAYIHHTVTENQHCCWIAQREGRAKDSDDRTQDSVIKMLGLAGHGDFAHHLAELHICPLAITYEYDPCDYLKARELQLKRDYPDW